MRRRLVAAVAVAALALSLAACTGENDDLATQYREGTNQGFISGDGSIEEIPAADRGGSVSFTGTGVDGETLSSEDYEGQVVVLNFWYALCAPCRTEAPILEEVAQSTAGDVSFLGANIYDGPAQARSFEERYGVTYPSLLLADDAELKLSFATWTSVTVAPTTLVLDKQGRVAARFFGAVRDASILETIVRDAVAEEL